jgi:hypothetical protein
MKQTILLVAVALLAGALPAHAQETPKTLVTTYDQLAGAILGVEGAETALVKSILTVHHDAAAAAMKAGNYDAASAQMALFANEGDNAIAGIRKRLLAGGHHHHHADEETSGEYEPGYVVVTREAKKEILAAAAALRTAGDDAGRQAAWEKLETVATKLLAE